MSKQFTLRQYFPKDPEDIQRINPEQLHQILAPIHFRVAEGKSGHSYKKGTVVKFGSDSMVRIAESGPNEMSLQALEEVSNGIQGGRIQFHELVPESFTREFIRYTMPFISQRAQYYARKLNYLEAMENQCPENPNEPLHLEDIKIRKVVKQLTKAGMTEAEKVMIIKKLMGGSEDIESPREFVPPSNEEAIPPMERANRAVDEIAHGLAGIRTAATNATLYGTTGNWNIADTQATYTRMAAQPTTQQAHEAEIHRMELEEMIEIERRNTREALG